MTKLIADDLAARLEAQAARQWDDSYSYWMDATDDVNTAVNKANAAADRIRRGSIASRFLATLPPAALAVVPTLTNRTDLFGNPARSTQPRLF